MIPGAAFTHKLHLIYLVNDLLHYWLVQAFQTRVHIKDKRVNLINNHDNNNN